MNSYANTDTLIGAALAPLDWTRSFGLAIVFSLFIAACAQFAIPVGEVPITGQTFAVGDRVHIIPNHICVAVNLHEQVYGLRGEQVEEVWRVEGRGKLQ